MMPNEALAYALGGRPGYEITGGSVRFGGGDLLEMEPHERAASGLFLGFQYPVEIPGVNNTYFLRSALNAQRKARGEPELDSMQFLKLVREKLAVLHLKDIQLPAGVVALQDENLVIANVSALGGEDEAAAGDVAEPEVIGKTKEEAAAE